MERVAISSYWLFDLPVTSTTKPYFLASYGAFDLPVLGQGMGHSVGHSHATMKIIWRSQGHTFITEFDLDSPAKNCNTECTTTHNYSDAEK
eukprot:scaffold46174_cov25-Prasinocladus_malaysianus.AAC.1